MKAKLLKKAFAYSSPVFLGYIAIGAAFGLLMSDAGFPWFLSLAMSVLMYAGAGQYIAVGLFAAGAGLGECVAVQFIVNARHIAYGLTLLKRFGQAGKFKWYLIFSLTDETFALLSSLPDSEENAQELPLFMFFVAVLDQSYWVLGTVVGAVAGSLLSFEAAGVDFALTALFIVLLIEQILRVRRAEVFCIAGVCALLTVYLFPIRLSLLAGMGFALVFVQLYFVITRSFRKQWKR